MMSSEQALLMRAGQATAGYSAHQSLQKNPADLQGFGQSFQQGDIMQQEKRNGRNVCVERPKHKRDKRHFPEY